jgi:hypothetical protein
MIKCSEVDGNGVVTQNHSSFTLLARKSCYLLSMKFIPAHWQRHIILLYYTFGFSELLSIYSKSCNLKWKSRQNFDLFITIFLDSNKPNEAYAFYYFMTKGDAPESKMKVFRYLIGSLVERRMFNQIFTIQYTEPERDSLKGYLRNEPNKVLYIKWLIALGEMNSAYDEYERLLETQRDSRVIHIDLLIKIKVSNAPKYTKIFLVGAYPTVFGELNILADRVLDDYKRQESMMCEEQGKMSMDTLKVVAKFISSPFFLK